MATNGMKIGTDTALEDDIFETEIERIPLRKRAVETRAPQAADPAEDFALGPVADKIAYGLSRGLVVAMKELETHIASETRKVSDTVERRLDTIQASLTEVAAFVREQRATNLVVQEKLQQLTATDSRQESELEALRGEAKQFSASVSQRIDATVESLKDADALQSKELTALQTETRAAAAAVSTRIDGICREVAVEQEDVTAIKSALSSVCSQIDALVERLDRQAEAVRLMHANNSQREQEVEQLMEGLARLRAVPKPLPGAGLSGL